MKHRQVYTVEFRRYGGSCEVEFTCVIASSKEEAYDLAVYEQIPAVIGSLPYSAWVKSVTYQNGNYRAFNTFEGKPY